MTAVSGMTYRLEDFLALLETPAARARLAHAAGQSSTAVAVLARQHAGAIAADFSWPVARFGDRLLSALFRRIFDGIAVRNLDAVRAVAEGATIVYLPCHRSHLDYLLLSQVIYRGGLMPPHVASGDNMNMPLLGRWLRKGGGFFMRRSFKGDPLYATVFALYLEGLLASGLPIEFFIEGGRSRTGLMLPPKIGLLGMVAEAFASAPLRPVQLVPVYLGYEKLPPLEAGSFVREQAGLPKQRESLWDLVGALRLLRHTLGQPCVSFGAPLDLSGWLDACCAGWRENSPAQRRTNNPDLAADLAADVVRRIEAAAPINPINLVALALPAGSGVDMPGAMLVARIAELKTRTDAWMTSMSPQDCVERALRLEMLEAVGERIVVSAAQAARLVYFRNNVLHHFPALYANAQEYPWTDPG